MKRIITVGICLLLALAWASTGFCQQTKSSEPAKPPAASQPATPSTEAKKPAPQPADKATSQEAKPWQTEERAPGKFNASEGC